MSTHCFVTMPLDTFICGNCQGAFNNINVFMGHKNEGCASQQPEIIQVHVNDSGEITEITDADNITGDPHSDTASALQSLFSDGIDHGVTLESFESEDGGTQTVIILSNPIDEEPSQETSQLIQTETAALTPKTGRKPGRPRKGQGKTPVVSASRETEKPTVPEKDKDGKLHCVRCKRMFTKERHFSTHKCLASSDYIDITQKDAIKMEAGEDIDLGDDDSDDAGAVEDYASDEYRMPNHVHADPDSDSGTVQKLEVWTETDPDSSVPEKATDYIEDIPVFKNEAEKFAFEQQLNVDLSCVDGMFKVHLIEQNLNEQADVMRNVSGSLSLYSCNVCEKVFKTLSHMRLHCLIHTDLKPFKCTECDYSSNAKGNLYTHMRKHTGQFYKCKKCSFHSVNKSHLVEHESTHSSSRHQCALCKKDYNTVKSLINHIRKYHPFSAMGREYLASFLKGHQRGATIIHQCHVCNRKFKKKIDRDRHLFVHDIKDLPNIQHCELCDYSASRRVYLEKHYQKHRVIYRCFNCESKFPSTIRLIDHLTSAHLQDDTSQWDSLFEKSIDNSLYLPEPQDSIKNKHVNIPDELKEVAVENIPDDVVLGAVDDSDLSLIGKSDLNESLGSKNNENSNDGECKMTTNGLLQSLQKPVSEELENTSNDIIKANTGLEPQMTSEENVQPSLPEDSDKNNCSLNTTSSTMVGDGDKNNSNFETSSALELNEQSSIADNPENNNSSFKNPPSFELTENLSTVEDSDKNSASFEKLSTAELKEQTCTSILQNTEGCNPQAEVTNIENDLSEQLVGKELEEKIDEICNKDATGDDVLKKDHAVDLDEDSAGTNDQEKENIDNKAATGTDKELKDFIEKLGYRNMTMEIFHKLRETFGTEECEFCGKLFYSKTDFEPHVRTHTGDKPFVCDNDSCSFRAISKEILRQHVDREHGHVQFQCKECTFVTNSRSQLWSHHLKHLGITGLECEKCKQKFNSLKVLRGHLLLVHPEIDKEEVARMTGYQLSHTHKIQGKLGRHTYKCPYCDRVFTRANSELQKHLWMHEGIKPFKCPMCSYGCRSKNNLQNHMLRHSAEKPFLCNECGKAYKSRTALRWHVKSHKHGKLFKCDKCPYEATQRSHLKRHQETHDVLKRFVCAHCDYSANTVGYLKIHYAKAHKGLAYVPSVRAPPRSVLVDSRVYKCLSCEYIFGNLSDLKRHLRIRHQVQVQGITDLDQVQISEVQVIQCAEEDAIIDESFDAVNSVENTQQMDDSSKMDEKTASAVNLLQQIIDISQQGTSTELEQQEIEMKSDDGQMVAVQAEDGQMMVVDPETIIVQQDGEQVILADGSVGPDGGYVIQYVSPGESLLEEISLEIQSTDS
ncbi:zinc finger protein ZFAT-like [Gigantopelta aegis]|uniref:zinc finger protein ZFAT-like n=1 Tax=Gigantopelta aegis TaxID=1735272 RepID=UPI001B88B97F|nr:zinc finger protein ZFAT-like [Gigantopelta aegis]